MGNRRVILIRENQDWELIYGCLVVQGDYNLEQLQKSIYELKEKIGNDYTVEDVINDLMEMYPNTCIEYIDSLQDLEI